MVKKESWEGIPKGSVVSDIDLDSLYDSDKSNRLKTRKHPERVSTDEREFLAKKKYRNLGRRFLHVTAPRGNYYRNTSAFLNTSKYRARHFGQGKKNEENMIHAEDFNENIRYFSYVFDNGSKSVDNDIVANKDEDGELNNIRSYNFSSSLKYLRRKINGLSSTYEYLKDNDCFVDFYSRFVGIHSPDKIVRNMSYVLDFLERNNSEELQKKRGIKFEQTFFDFYQKDACLRSFSLIARSSKYDDLVNHGDFNVVFLDGDKSFPAVFDTTLHTDLSANLRKMENSYNYPFGFSCADYYHVRNYYDTIESLPRYCISISESSISSESIKDTFGRLRARFMVLSEIHEQNVLFLEKDKINRKKMFQGRPCLSVGEIEQLRRIDSIVCPEIQSILDKMRDGGILKSKLPYIFDDSDDSDDIVNYETLRNVFAEEAFGNDDDIFDENYYFFLTCLEKEITEDGFLLFRNNDSQLEWSSIGDFLKSHNYSSNMFDAVFPDSFIDNFDIILDQIQHSPKSRKVREAVFNKLRFYSNDSIRNGFTNDSVCYDLLIDEIYLRDDLLTLFPNTDKNTGHFKLADCYSAEHILGIFLNEKICRKYFPEILSHQEDCGSLEFFIQHFDLLSRMKISKEQVVSLMISDCISKRLPLYKCEFFKFFDRDTISREIINLGFGKYIKKIIGNKEEKDDFSFLDSSD